MSISNFETVAEIVDERPGRISARLRAAAPPAIVMISVVALWQILVTAFNVPPFIFAKPTEIFTQLTSRWSTQLSSATWVTLQEVVIGFSVALITALLIATALHMSPSARRAVYPLLIGSQTIPIIVIGPILAIIFGYGILPKVILVTLICFFPIVVTTIDGLASVDPQLIRMMKTLYGTRISIFRRIEFPAALPSMFSGIRVGATYAAIGAVFGEYAGSTDGLGYVMIIAAPMLQVSIVFAAILLLSIMSISLFLLVTIAERIIVPWAKYK